jgi:hypothetical protein
MAAMRKPNALNIAENAALVAEKPHFFASPRHVTFGARKWEKDDGQTQYRNRYKRIVGRD